MVAIVTHVNQRASFTTGEICETMETGTVTLETGEKKTQNAF